MKKKKRIFIIIAVILLIIILTVVGKVIYDKYEEQQKKIAIESKEYLNNLKSLCAYLEINEKNCYDCNSTMSNLMTTYTSKTAMINSLYKKLGHGTVDSGALRKDFFNILKENNTIIEEKLKKIEQPLTVELEESYKKLKDSYNSYYKSYELALNPVENYITYTNDITKYHENFEENYKQLKETIVDFNIEEELKQAKSYINNRDGFLPSITTSMSYLKTYIKLQN